MPESSKKPSYRGQRRYRKWSVRAWGDDLFNSLGALEPCPKSLYLYLVLGPHAGALPCAFSAGRAQLAEALEWTPKQFAKQFDKLSRKGMAKADWRKRVVYLPGTLKHDPPANPNVCKAWARALMDLPDSALQVEAHQAIEEFLADQPNLLQGFSEGLGERFRSCLLNQQQQHGQQPHQQHGSEPSVAAGLSFADGGAAAPSADRTSEFVRAATWIRENLPSLETSAADLLQIVATRAKKVGGPGALRADIETAVSRARAGENPAGLFLTIVGNGKRRKR